MENLDEYTKKLRQEREELEIDEVLEDPCLLGNIVKEVQKKVVGETDTINTIVLFKCGELVKNCEPTSYNLFLSEESGVGKDYVLTKTLELFPDNYREHKAKITPEVLTYWHNVKFEPEWTWDRKSLYLEEIAGNVLNSDTFVAFTSQRDFEMTALIKQFPVTIKGRGKPVIFVTTASKNPKYDLLRRFAFAGLDDSVDQTRAIIKRQFEAAQEGIVLEFDKNLTRALAGLELVSVKIPFSNEISNYLTKNNSYEINKILRTTNPRFIDLIKAAAALYQKQRERDEHGTILATWEDYDVAIGVLKKIMHSASTIPMTKEKKKVLKIFEAMGGNWYRVAEIEPKITFCSHQKLYDLLREMADANYLACDKMEYEDKNGRSHEALHYKVIDAKKFEFPTSDELRFRALSALSPQLESTNKTEESMDSKDNVDNEESEETKHIITKEGLDITFFNNNGVLTTKKDSVK